MLCAESVHKIGKTTDDWFNNMDAEMRRGLSRKYNTKDNAVIEGYSFVSGDVDDQFFMTCTINHV
jgi:hypothetical protein